MTYVPEKKKHIIVFVIICFAFIVFSSVMAVKVFSLPSVIWQSAFFIMSIIVCELAVKYFIPVYTYIIDGESFIITKTLGNKVTTVCNIDTYRISCVVTKSDYKNSHKKDVASIYNYSCNPFNKSSYVLIFEYSNSHEAVIFEPNEAMVDFIRDRIKNQ